MTTTTRTKIIATIGPSSSNPVVLEQLVKAGMNIARINCSHADHDTIAKTVKTVREISERLDLPIGILLDLSGPKLRTKKLANGQVELIAGRQFTLTSRELVGNEE